MDDMETSAVPPDYDAQVRELEINHLHFESEMRELANKPLWPMAVAGMGLGVVLFVAGALIAKYFLV